MFKIVKESSIGAFEKVVNEYIKKGYTIMSITNDFPRNHYIAYMIEDQDDRPKQQKFDFNN